MAGFRKRFGSFTNPRFGCSIFKTANQSCPDGAQTQLTGFTEVEDVGGFFVAGGDAIVIPGGADGVYVISAGIAFAANVTGTRRLTVLKNGAGSGVLDIIDNAPNVGGSQGAVAGGRFLVLEAGDTLTLFATQGSGGALNALAGNSDLENTFMTCHRVSL